MSKRFCYHISSYKCSISVCNRFIKTAVGAVHSGAKSPSRHMQKLEPVSIMKDKKNKDNVKPTKISLRSWNKNEARKVLKRDLPANIIVQKQDGVVDTTQCVSNLISERYHDTNTSDISKIFHSYIFKASTKRFYALSQLRIYYLWYSYFTIGPIQNIPSKEPHDIWPYPCPGFIIQIIKRFSFAPEKECIVIFLNIRLSMNETSLVII